MVGPTLLSGIRNNTVECAAGVPRLPWQKNIPLYILKIFQPPILRIMKPRAEARGFLYFEKNIGFLA